MKELSRGVVPPKHEQLSTDGETSTMNVKILGKDFQVSCPANEQEDLMKAADQLDDRMRDIRESGKVIGLERIAVMAGLNITNEFLQIKDQADNKESSNLLKKLNRKLDKALQNARQMEI